jgi:hypothetical protein
MSKINRSIRDMQDINNSINISIALLKNAKCHDVAINILEREYNKISDVINSLKEMR